MFEHIYIHMYVYIHICDFVNIHISIYLTWSQKQGAWGEALRSWKQGSLFISDGWKSIHHMGQCFAQLINIELRLGKIAFFLFCLNQCVICWQKILTRLSYTLPHNTSKWEPELSDSKSHSEEATHISWPLTSCWLGEHSALSHPDSLWSPCLSQCPLPH